MISLSLFIKHEIKENEGRFEAFLSLSKKHTDRLNDDPEFLQHIKKEALALIKCKFPSIPIRVIRIMIGSVPYVSFANTIKSD